jgi:hypothetical protein
VARARVRVLASRHIASAIRPSTSSRGLHCARATRAYKRRVVSTSSWPKWACASFGEAPASIRRVAHVASDPAAALPRQMRPEHQSETGTYRPGPGQSQPCDSPNPQVGPDSAATPLPLASAGEAHPGSRFACRRPGDDRRPRRDHRHGMNRPWPAAALGQSCDCSTPPMMLCTIPPETASRGPLPPRCSSLRRTGEPTIATAVVGLVGLIGA